MSEQLTAAHFEHSSNFVSLLDQLKVSLAITTYQAGKVVLVGGRRDEAGRDVIHISFHHFDQPMGLARTPAGLAVGTKRQIWMLNAANEFASRIAPAGMYDSCFLARSSIYTGPILGHEMAWNNNELWVVNTLFSCLCVASAEFSFVPRWRPPFISALAAEDRCHLNGMCLKNGSPYFVTALSETDTPAGWRPGKATGGVMIDVAANQVVLRGLSMPHSPRVYGDHLLVLDSGRGNVCVAEPAANRVSAIAAVPGYARGMDTFGKYAFVGLSRIRETAVFGGLPIAERRGELRCGVAVVDLESGQVAAFLYFKSGVEEVFEVKVLPGFRTPHLSGPSPDKEDTEAIWVVPGSQP